MNDFVRIADESRSSTIVLDPTGTHGRDRDRRVRARSCGPTSSRRSPRRSATCSAAATPSCWPAASRARCPRTGTRRPLREARRRRGVHGARLRGRAAAARPRAASPISSCPTRSRPRSSSATSSRRRRTSCSRSSRSPRWARAASSSRATTARSRSCARPASRSSCARRCRCSRSSRRSAPATRCWPASWPRAARERPFAEALRQAVALRRRQHPARAARHARSPRGAAPLCARRGGRARARRGLRARAAGRSRPPCWHQRTLGIRHRDEYSSRDPGRTARAPVLS